MTNNTDVEQYRYFYFKNENQKWSYLQFLQNTYGYEGELQLQGLKKEGDKVLALTPRIRILKLWREFLKEKRKEKNRTREIDITQAKPDTPTKRGKRGDING